jgi:hypothetical protein
LNLLEICAELVRHHRLTQQQILELDRFWIAHVYFAPRGKYGELIVSPKAKTTNILTDPWEMFQAMGRSWGWEPWFILHRYELAKSKAGKGKAG